MKPVDIWIGYDADESAAYHVAETSLATHASIPINIHRLWDQDLRVAGLYKRPTICRNGRLWDIISEAPMSTGHAIARFFLPLLMKREGWALFTDGDVLFRRDIKDLFDLADPTRALMVVKHDYQPTASLKKGGDIQMRYSRKNWSSVILWNLAHPAHERLTLQILNSVPGRGLHAFDWLETDEIGALPVEWNWLVNHSPNDLNPAIVHFTEGLPDILSHEDDPYADEWRSYVGDHPSYRWLEKAHH